MNIMNTNRWIHFVMGGVALAFVCATSCTAQTTVTGQVRIERPGSVKNVAKGKAGDGEVVVWLKPVDGSAVPPLAKDAPRPKLVQKDKKFEPHLLVVRAGAVVDFPNRDPFFHNVFSLFDGKRFDLGLYEAGATNSVRFDRPGVSFLFCNIHPEMSAVVISLDTPYYAVSNDAGAVTIAGVPDGRYEMHVWYEKSLPEVLTKLTKVVRVDSSSSRLGSIAVQENQSFAPEHKNKYGQEYTPPPTNNSYSHP
jgi:plastocyanin